MAIANLQRCADFVKICQPASAKRNSQSVVHRSSAGSRICLGIISVTVQKGETGTALYSLIFSPATKRVLLCLRRTVDGPTALACFASKLASKLPKVQRAAGCRTQAWQNRGQEGVDLRLVKF